MPCFASPDVLTRLDLLPVHLYAGIASNVGSLPTVLHYMFEKQESQSCPELCQKSQLCQKSNVCQASVLASADMTHVEFQRLHAAIHLQKK